MNTGSNVLPISRYDTLLYDITLEQKSSVTGEVAPLITGVVTSFISLWPPSLTPIAGTDVVMSHAGDGRWLGEIPDQFMNSALSSIADNTPVAVIYTVNGSMVRYREAVIAAIKRSEAL